ncbi:hypothetical protein CXB51_035259 [Gossypium anomalum]|uniref:RING-type domain-containing protein n=1 Tax=Gossypium anomalum TaxID=47600 RepID=A0A8J5Y3A9_9ROSI|nr:hypothetical protein CXB51_035259 [Gossypium anomalum]
MRRKKCLYQEPSVSSSTLLKTSTSFTKLCFPCLQNSESTQPLLVITASFMKFSNVDEECHIGCLAEELIVKRCLYDQRLHDMFGRARVGFDAFRIPCSHNFHGDCIKKWLRHGNCCPIC